ncbi:MAG: hypothetical protein MPJ24_11355 [Pirellulaceae bacterium]|nr:hypothetical protein [Pirellulaceae bacterium]
MTDKLLRTTNPFSVHAVHPKVFPYLYEQEETHEKLWKKFASFAWRGEVVGPHGTGKSTWAYSFAKFLESRGEVVTFCALAKGERRLPFS